MIIYIDEAPSCSIVKNWFNEFIRGRRSHKDAFREDRLQSAIASKNTDTVHVLIVHDCFVTYLKIEQCLGISSISIHSILPGRKRFLPFGYLNCPKKARVNCGKEMQAKYDGGASKDVYKIVTGEKPWIYAYEPETKQQSTMRDFESEPHPTKDVCLKIKSLPVSST